MTEVDYNTLDRWNAAREETARRGSWSTKEKLFTFISQSFPGGPTRQVPFSIVTTNRAIGVDLNEYRPDTDVEMLADLGVKIFDLRCFNPKRWVFNDWRYAQDPTFEPYLNRLVKIPDIIIGGYGVYNPWLDEEAGYKSPLDPNVELMKLYMKNYISSLHYTMWDVEVGECVKGANQHNGITANNLVLGLSHTLLQTTDEMLHWPNGYPRIPEMYSANWFLLKYGGDAMAVFLENSLANVNAMPFLTWLAWVPTVFNGYYEKPTDLFDLLITPNGVQENAYLHRRSEPLAVKWQATWHLKGPWSPKVGIDASVTYGLGSSLSSYKYLHNIPAGTEPPNPDDPPDPTGKYVTLEAFNAHLKSDTAHPHIHTVGGPVNL